MDLSSVEGFDSDVEKGVIMGGVGADIECRSPYQVEVNLVGGRDILINPTRRSKIGDPMDLIELARQVQTADHFTKANVTNKLSVIVDQIRYLQDQAKKILEEASQAQDLHHVPCNFKKIPGKIYYLYEKGPPNQRLFSMLSPQEWGKNCPYNYLGAFKLQYDMSWTPVGRLAEKEQDLQLLNRIIQGSQNKAEEPFSFSITDITHENGHN